LTYIDINQFNGCETTVSLKCLKTKGQHIE